MTNEFQTKRLGWYQKNKARISELQKRRYATDLEYRDKRKANARNFYTTADKMEMRKAAYWTNPVRFRKLSKEWNEKNRDKYLRRAAAYRELNRATLRAKARNESLLLTDSYVRNQLSKYSAKSTHEWASYEVHAKRQRIIKSRRRRKL